METLKPGSTFPDLRGDTVEGEPLEIPRETMGAPLILLLYRGRW